MGKQYWRGGNMLYPVPAVMISCGRPEEKPNIITVAWAGTVCSSPAMVSISVRKERYSYDILKETGEFVINLITRDLTYATDFCGVRSGRDVDKFEQMHLTPLPSQHISAPGIAESPVNLECKVTQVIPLGSHDMFIAEVLGVTVDEKYMDENGKFHLNDAGLVAYSHGEGFILQDISGTGMAFLEVDGDLVNRYLEPGEVLKVDTGNVVAFERTVTYDVEMIKGLGNIFFGGEGLFLTKLVGPGRVIIQTQNIAEFAGRIARFIPTSGK